MFIFVQFLKRVYLTGAQESIKRAKITSDEASLILEDTDRVMAETFNKTMDELIKRVNETKEKILQYYQNHKSQLNETQTIYDKMQNYLNEINLAVSVFF